MKTKSIVIVMAVMVMLMQTACMAATPAVSKTGYIIKTFTSNSKQYASVDWIRWVGIKEAKADPAIWKAAQADEAVQEDETGSFFYDDYYIYNPDKKVQNVPFAKNIKISVCDFDSESPASHSKTLSVKDFQKKIKAGDFKDITFDITVDKNMITKISERYQP